MSLYIVHDETEEMLCSLSMASTSAAGVPGPPPETVEAVEFSSSILQVQNEEKIAKMPQVPGGHGKNG